MTYAIAHRGLCVGHRENTMPAFEAALEHAQVIELDVRATSDCVLVCAHDRTLLRCYGDASHVGRLTWAELQQVAPDIPRVEDVLDSFGGRAGWILDCKVSRPRAVAELERVVAAAGLSWDTGAQLRAGVPIPAGGAAFESPDGNLLHAFRARTGAGCLELVRGASPAAELALTAPFITAYAQAVTIPDRIATRRMLRMLRALRLGTYVYTVNEQPRIDELARRNASGIFTDDVAQLTVASS